MQTLALVHTSMVFLTVETMMSDLLDEILPDVRLINLVDDSLLPDVMEAGEVTQPVKERMKLLFEAGEAAGADAIFSVCSSLGPGTDFAKPFVSIPVVKIDDAMALRAAESGTRIGVMATVPTTLGPTCDLIQQKADSLDKKIEVTPCLVQGAFEKLMGGSKDEHDRMVCAAAKDLSASVDIIAFAQASMTRLAPRISGDTGLDVFTSPRLGIEYVKTVLDGLKG
jgi:Asp/Glu/hydantoin racemase